MTALLIGFSTLNLGALQDACSLINYTRGTRLATTKQQNKYKYCLITDQSKMYKYTKVHVMLQAIIYLTLHLYLNNSLVCNTYFKIIELANKFSYASQIYKQYNVIFIP